MRIHEFIWISLFVTHWFGLIFIEIDAVGLKANKHSLRKKSPSVSQGSSKISSDGSKRAADSGANRSAEEIRNISAMKANSISRVVEYCNSQSALKGEEKKRFFFLKCEYNPVKKVITVPQIDTETKKVADGGKGDLVYVNWKLNLEGANSALVYGILFVSSTLQYSVIENCVVLPQNLVLKGDSKNPSLAKKLFDCTNGNLIQPITSFKVLAKVDTYFNLRPSRLYTELERVFRVSQLTYTYKANSKTPEVRVNLHPKYYVVKDKFGNEIMNDMLITEKLEAIPYIKIILALRNSNFLHDLLYGKDFFEQKTQVARWYRRILRGIWLPFYTTAMFMFQNGYKVHCDLHTRNIMVVVDPSFGSESWKAINTVVEVASITPESMKIVDIGNTISMNTEEIQTTNDPCKKYERRPYEDIGLLDYRVLDPLTVPVKAPNFLPQEDQIYSEELKIENIRSIRTLIKYYNSKLSRLKASIRSVYQWESCRVKRVNNKTKRLHPEADKYPCRFVDQRDALIEACKILKRYTAEQFMGVPSCNLSSRRNR
ncbi:hypothetical protein FG386_003141 [Cryptosporidium ryanae]|uniref:uncharacterized protein n=1 Tax=Cryptosporidium ryanae TaxID=515981 RepID=UPI00351A0021|nr:hypothetical protein FG386_003141 [Cryptosporidium ryanae]